MAAAVAFGKSTHPLPHSDFAVPTSPPPPGVFYPKPCGNPIGTCYAFPNQDFPYDPLALVAGCTIKCIQDAEVLVFHMPCIDGMLAASMAYWANPRLKLIGVTHDALHAGAIDKEIEGKRTIFCDICPKPEKLRPRLDLVIDHHPATAEIVDPPSDGELKRVIFDGKKSGAGLMWWYLTRRHPQAPDTPLFLRAVDSRDRGLFDVVPLSGALYTAIGDSTCVGCYMDMLYQPLRFVAPEVLKAEQERLARVQQLVPTARAFCIGGRRAWVVCDVHHTLVSELGRGILTTSPDRQHDVAALLCYNAELKTTRWSFRSIDGESARTMALYMKGNGHGDAAGATTEGEDWEKFTEGAWVEGDG